LRPHRGAHRIGLDLHPLRSRKAVGAFNGPGFHRTALYFSETAQLHPGGLFAVVGGVIEFGGGVALALGLGARLAGIALFGDMVMAMITVRWVTGINNSTTPPGYQLNLTLGVLALVMVVFGAGRSASTRLPSATSCPWSHPVPAERRSSSWPTSRVGVARWHSES
jgi:uncharacterized membrane protein YphA (DoxX/SURF4 family)